MSTRWRVRNLQYQQPSELNDPKLTEEALIIWGFVFWDRFGVVLSILDTFYGL